MRESPDDFRTWLDGWREKIDATLDDSLPRPDVPPGSIHEAMRYSVLAGGKRVRPILAVAAAEACGSDPSPLLRHFCSLELIHTYSLIHDDLPALDDDELRRGRPTSHVVYGEALAILAGDALLTEAFAWLTTPLPGVPAERLLEAAHTVSLAIDSKGMIGGQVADLEAENLPSGDREALLARLEFIHRNKTGRLLTAAVVLGGLFAGANDRQLEALGTYGESIGLAFQIQDDLLDLEEDAATLGKTAGKDVEQGKLTYPALLGADQARLRLGELIDEARANAAMIGGPVNYLGPIASYIGQRRS